VTLLSPAKAIWVIRATPKDRADQAAVDFLHKVDGVAVTTLSTSSRWAILPPGHRSGTSLIKDAAWPLHFRARPGR
jgi:hypothetical protein